MTTNTRPVLALTATALAAALALTSCSDSTNAEDSAFTYGLLYPQTGSLAFLGPPQLSAVEYAISQINDAGGILGDQVPPPIQADEAGDNAQANEAANSLVNDNVNAVIGAAASAMTQATYDTITGSQIVQCSGSNTAPELSDINDGGYFFRTAPSDLMAGPVLAQQMVEDGHTSVAIVARADDYGTGYLTAVENELDSLGIDVLVSETYDPDSTNFGAVIDGVYRADADAIALISFEEGTQLMAALIESEVRSTFYLTDGLNDPGLGETVADNRPRAIDGTTGVAPSADNPEFNEGLREFDPELEAFQFTPQIFDCVTAVALAAESAGSPDPTVYVEHLPEISRPEGTECTTFAECRDLLDQDQSIDYQGTSGNIDFDDNGDPTSATFELFHFGEDGYEILGYTDYSLQD
ncbi:ABC transporter substrate-binding protein [Nocardiopsis sp. JB363]|uniref:ABC transporter substrate-binding protein n=1 Tax=Nocardiopsis sp. JB363 TaxID=1434837 RepID=UPI00097A9FE0|nr:ABC transporter substrate-binding protein [Nocardiopsis sp. JB363]SIO85418.1 Branched-chain amino acid ABC transporter, amino acid-binding protein (TC 3.A.1.4.1) [Nocardiopsis sp. JB363]